jgi:hypothetical protein
MFRRVSVESIEGVRYEVWKSDSEADSDVRIPDDWLEAVVFLYENEGDARTSSHLGGTGFIIGLTAAGVKGSHPYVVTNRHVAESCPVVRVVARDGGVTSVIYDEDEWIYHPDFDDIAVARLPANLVPRMIPVGLFMTEALFEELYLGPGDEVFIMGRFIGLDERLENTPTVRFGQLAMGTVERVTSDYTKLSQESFVVEMRTLTGYSGSPTFVHIAGRPGGIPKSRASKSLTDTLAKRNRRGGTWLLGIEWGNLHRYQRVREKIGEGREATYEPIDEPWWVRENSGMSLIVPAWKIRETLMDGRLQKQRKEAEDRSRELRDAAPSAGTTNERDDPPSLTRGGFENALRKVSRRVKPSQSDEGTSGTSE